MLSEKKKKITLISFIVYSFFQLLTHKISAFDSVLNFINIYIYIEDYIYIYIYIYQYG